MIRSLAVALALTACCPKPTIKVVGQAPAGADAVLAAATVRWPGWHGTVKWFPVGALTLPGTPALVHGYAYGPGRCGDVAVAVEFREPATLSALAHELCHAVGGAETQEAADACAAEITREATRGP